MSDLTVTTETKSSINVFSNQENFENAQRMATALSASSLVPESFRGKANLPNVLIAMELAARIGASVIMVMQNLDVIHGRPSWRAQFLIATVNASNKFTPLRYRFEGEPGTDSWGCRAVAKDREHGDECVGPLITMKLAKDEGWATKSGSKWRTMPELMMHYRAAAFWTRVYCPELSLGMRTAEEVIDTFGEDVTNKGTVQLPAGLAKGDPKALTATLLGTPSEVVNEVTGEVMEATAE